jgi:hypothetical protein
MLFLSVEFLKVDGLLSKSIGYFKAQRCIHRHMGFYKLGRSWLENKINEINGK